MRFFKFGSLMSAMLVGSAAMSFAVSASVTVTNKDATAHVIVTEDDNEHITETTIAAGQTLENLCEGGCFIWLKDVEDAQFVPTGKKIQMVIQSSQLSAAP